MAWGCLLDGPLEYSVSSFIPRMLFKYSRRPLPPISPKHNMGTDQTAGWRKLQLTFKDTRDSLMTSQLSEKSLRSYLAKLLRVWQGSSRGHWLLGGWAIFGSEAALVQESVHVQRRLIPNDCSSSSSTTSGLFRDTLHLRLNGCDPSGRCRGHHGGRCFGSFRGLRWRCCGVAFGRNRLIFA